MNLEKQLFHLPIMPQIVGEFLVNDRHGIFLDCTFGGGGHSRYLLEKFPEIQLHAIDRDPETTPSANLLKVQFGDRFQFLNIPFSKIDMFENIFFDGIFFDFGISSIQLDDERRGFSFRHHSLLDMRMNSSTGMTAHEFLLTASQSQLVEAIRDFGEERYWKLIVDAILENRGGDVLRYADSFAQLIATKIPQKFYDHIHPATRTFQGIRIAINSELEEIRTALPRAFALLRPNGRLVALSFHSLEDRIVKQFFNKCAGKAIDCNEKWNDRQAVAKILTKKPISPSDLEVRENPRSRSAKLRTLEKF